MQFTENTLFDNRYMLKRLIGRGGFAEVWLVEDTLTSLEEALKIYAPGAGLDEDGVSMFMKELAVVHNLRHTNLLTPKYMGQYERQPYLVLPYCPYGSLAKKVGNISEEDAWKIIRQVASGLAYLHDKDIIHQDIKPDNILIDANGDYVITDFGISMKVQSTLRKSMRATAQSGTTNYMAPERFTSIKPRPENDIWSLGAMMYELLEGDVPFNTPIGSIAQINGTQIPAMESTTSDKLKNNILSMLALNVEDRPKATALAGVTFEHATAPSLDEENAKASTIAASSAETTRIDVEALKKEAEDKRKAEAEEEYRLRIEASRRKLQEEERQQAEIARRKEEEEAAYIAQVRKEAKEALARQKAQEAEAKRKAEEDAFAEQARKEAREALARKKAQEAEAEAQQKIEKNKRRIEEQKRRLAEQKRAEEARRKAEEEAKRQAERERLARWPKFCNKCGNRLTPGQKFCNKCGNQINIL